MKTREYLILQFWKYSEKDIYNIKKEVPSFRHVNNNLPEYSLTSNKIMESEYWLQYTGVNEEMLTDSTFLMFNNIHSSPFLKEEISIHGLIELFNEQDIRLNFNSLISKFNFNTSKTVIPKETVLIFDLEYIDPEEGDFNLTLHGLLDDKLEIDSTFDLLEMKSLIK